MKSKVVLFVTGYIMLIFSSCLSSDEVDYELSRDAQIKEFKLSHDSISGLSNVKFIIDQVAGQIYNRDSLPFGTDISEKLWADITFTSAVSQVEIYQQATGDTIYWTGNTENDSINFTKPVNIKTTAVDGSAKMHYTAQLNVHTVLPDTMEWKRLNPNEVVNGPITGQKVVTFPVNGKESFLKYSKLADGWDIRYAPFDDPENWTSLGSERNPGIIVDQIIRVGDYLYAPDGDGHMYVSFDGTGWDDITIPEVSVLYMLGLLDDNTLCIVGQLTGEPDNRFITLNINSSTISLEQTGNIIPDDFPLEDFSRVNYENINHSPMLLLFSVISEGSTDKGVAWYTRNGVDWEQYENAKIPVMKGASVIRYDDQLYLFGGFEGNTASKKILISKDRGVNWNESGTLVALPSEYDARGYSSVLVDRDQYIYIFGGKKRLDDATLLDEVWRGRINRLGFAIQ